MHELTPRSGRPSEGRTVRKLLRERGPFGFSFAVIAIAIGTGAYVSACDQRPAPASSYFDERIQPIFNTSCVQQTTGCHIASDQGTATGNIDLSSYDALMRRRDALPAYGPYSVGLLLLKGGPDRQMSVETIDPPDPSMPERRFVTFTTDIRHNAGEGISETSDGYRELKQWIESGHLRTGVPDETLNVNDGECQNGIGEHPFFDAAAPPVDAESYNRFRNEVWPRMKETCAGSSCHGSHIADLYLTCGDNEDEMRWNYFVAVAHLSEVVSTSPLLRQPLSQLRGGVFHEGGNILESTDDPTYQAIRSWAEELVMRTPAAVRYPDTVDPGFRFFVNRVQPTLVRKGCMFMNCHGPAMFHDLRLRGGAQGQFGRVSSWRNYEKARLLLGIESPDPNEGRVVGKNLYPADTVPGGQGMLHRGGFLLEDFGASGSGLTRATPDLCAGVDADTGNLDDIPAYCVFVRWHQIEREQAIMRGELPMDPVQAVVWVSRPTGVGDVRDFDTYRGGADLMIADATVDATGALSLSGERSLNAGCGFGDADIRKPAVSWDGTKIAVGVRQGAGQPWRIYEMNADGSGCAQITDIGAGSDMGNGVMIHDFDPAYAPDGRLVFASTRGNIMGEWPYSGPTRTPAAMQPNANLYVREGGGVRQLTFLLNQEVWPNFMGDGRVIMTAEKREPEFHQLAGRRQNLDGGDYHPLFAQRNSVGFTSATHVVELPNKNLVFVAGEIGAPDGAGAIALVNRSIGPDQTDRDPGDRAYLSSMDILTRSGAYRSTSQLPTGRILAACDPAGSPGAGPFAFQICEVDAHSGNARTIGGTAGRANVDPVAVYARIDLGVFTSRPDEANGHTEVEPGATDAVITIHDFPLLGTLLFSNTRVGRPIDHDIEGFDIFEAMPPPEGTSSFAEVADRVQDDAFGQVFVDYRHRGWTHLEADGSAKIQINGGMPMILRPTDGGGSPFMFGPDAPFSGEIIQREQMQFYVGERSNQSFQRRFFNGLCAGCHGSITGRELDVAVNVDILTSASKSMARDISPADVRR